MRLGPIIPMIIVVVLISSAHGELPLGFYSAMNNAGQKDVLSVRNYDSGAVLTEAYTNIEQLERNTQVNTKSYGTDDSAADPGGSLEASISSNVIGSAHIAWQSVDPSVSTQGRHPILGRSIEDLTGVFSIEKFIQLWSSSQPGEVSVDWLPCS
ncbi:MAG: hypothetical protein NTW84_07010 [Methanothrix sp.]|nr:hypothetical protein [Methanothrix sp.]